jgi:Pyruvate/2-oxoacid:ferredoxin oxidoreductase gamma subunit
MDIWELCVAYYVPANKLTRPGLLEMSKRLNLPFGLLQTQDAAEPAGNRFESSATTEPAAVDTTENEMVQPPKLAWSGRKEICIAGSAGQHIRSAAGVIGEVAVAGGLYAAQYDDFPITVRRGHSVSNLIISDQPIRYTGVDAPELMIVLSDDGAKRLGGFEHLSENCLILADQGIDPGATRAKIRRVSLRGIEKLVGKASASLATLTAGMRERGWVKSESFTSSANSALGEKYRDANMKAIRAGFRLVPEFGPNSAAGCPEGEI